MAEWKYLGYLTAASISPYWWWPHTPALCCMSHASQLHKHCDQCTERTTCTCEQGYWRSINGKPPAISLNKWTSWFSQWYSSMLMHFSAALHLKANWTEIDNAVSDSRLEKVNIWTKFPLNPSREKLLEKAANTERLYRDTCPSHFFSLETIIQFIW